MITMVFKWSYLKFRKPVVTHVDKDTLLSAFEELQSYFK